jgi:hypothetical protein
MIEPFNINYKDCGASNAAYAVYADNVPFRAKADTKADIQTDCCTKHQST